MARLVRVWALILIPVAGLAALHTLYLISGGNVLYALLREPLTVLVTGGLMAYNIRQALRSEEHFYAHLALACVFAIALTIHALKIALPCPMDYGGILC
ncbi:hypothetical protein JXB02_05960 [Candidatus Woesearchaeota archaeon]|nr:hypothetical protein [Candidatus Woesearchaeota archaeon]